MRPTLKEDNHSLLKFGKIDLIKKATHFKVEYGAYI